jgi:PAS domain S-box-containing protein
LVDSSINKVSDSGERSSGVAALLGNGMDQRGIRVGSFVWDLEDNSMQCSANTHSVVGLDSVSSFEEALSIIHSDDRDRFLKETAAMISERRTRPIEFRVVLPDGAEKVLFAVGEFVCDSQGKPIRCSGVVCDISESKRTDEAFRHIYELRKLVTSISTRFINLDPDEVDAEIQGVLQRLGEFANVDRSYVFLRSDDGKIMSNTHEWCAEGIPSEMLRSQAMPAESLPWLYERLMRFEIVNIPDVSKLPRAAKAEKAEFHRQEIESLLVVPMVLRRVLTGFVGFDSVKEKKTWPEDIVAVLRLVGEIIANAIDRKRTEIKLKQSEEKYRALVQDAYSIMLRMDSHGTVTFCNEFAERFFGFSAEELIGRNVVGTIVPEYESTGRDLKWLIEDIGRNPGCYLNNVNENQRKNGERVWVAWTNRPVLSDDDQTVETLRIGNDITQRKRAEEALAKSEAKYRALFDYSSDAILLLKDERCIECNSQSERMFGYSRDKIIGSTPIGFSPLFQPDGRRSQEKGHELLSKALTGKPQVFEWLHQRQDGTLIDTEISLTVVHLGNETLAQCIIRDITDRKLSENELEISRRRLQSLANHLVSVREDEKCHIARELHDELGQALTALNMDLKWLGGKLRKNRTILSAKTDQMAGLVMQTIQTVKRIQGELRPTLLDNLGLIAAMEWQVKEFQERTNLDVSFNHPGEIETDADRAIALFRIFQEAQTNVAKHAGASRVEIDLSETEDYLLLTVIDDGRGLRPEDYNKPDSFGLLGIQERISSLQGKFSIVSKDGDGARLQIKIPK